MIKYQNGDAYQINRMNDDYRAQVLREAVRNLFHSITNGSYRDVDSEKINLKRIHEALRLGLYSAEHTIASKAVAAYEAWDYSAMREVMKEARGW